MRFGLVGTGFWARTPCDIEFGRDVVRVLAAAQAQLDAARPGLDDPPRL
jgi:hypothetical protein